MQALGRMCQQVAVLVNRTALDRNAVPHRGDRSLKPRRAIDDKELGTAQATPDEIVEHCTLGFGALAAHTLDREQHFLTVRTHADDDRRRDRGRLAVEPHAHHGAVKNQPHNRFIGQRAGIPRVPIALYLAPHPAHRVLADDTRDISLERRAGPGRNPSCDA